MELSRDQLDARVWQACGGDRAAVNDLLRVYRPWIRKLAESALRPDTRARLDPSDVVQEASAYVAQCIADFRGQSAAEFEAWLRPIIQHKAIDAERRERAGARDVRREVSLDDGSRSGPALASGALVDDSTPSRQAIRREKFLRAIDSIRDENREVVRLYVWERLDLPVIAERLAMSLEVAALRLERGMRTLKQRLQSDRDGSDESASP